ncbi:alpha/beta hydrolase fold domain-containing protein [Streptomyces griseochromogenes]|uniref:alpha/beta hydrolase fold domain-containing protein n=1 Tax=Streptomyces griseochromogenes TaxID=68214 RepID=UPI00379488A9
MTCTSQIEGPLPAQRQLVTRRLCRDVGAVVAAVHYRRSPGHPFPAPYDDCLAAARHVADSVTDYGARRDRLAVAGDSAGANLAAVIAQTFRDEHRPLAAQLLAYPPTDSDGDYPSRTQNATGYMLTSENIADIQYLYAGNDPVVVTYEHLAAGGFQAHTRLPEHVPRLRPCPRRYCRTVRSARTAPLTTSRVTARSGPTSSVAL